MSIAPAVLVLTGPHGAGKSRHAFALATALGAVAPGVRLHQPGPPPDWCRSHWDRALHYALERERDLGAGEGGVLVAARWDESTLAAAAHAPSPQAAAMMRLAEVEAELRPPPRGWFYLDAAEEVLDARLLRRHGRPQTPEEKAEAAYLRKLGLGLPVYRTDQPFDVVAAELLAAARAILGGPWAT